MGKVEEIIAAIDKMAEGKLPPHLTVDSKDFVGKLTESTNHLIDTLSNLYQQARPLAEGDLSQPITAQGDIAGIFKTIQANLRHMAWQLSRVRVADDFSQWIVGMGELGQEFNQMVHALKEAKEELEETREQLVRSERLAAIGQLAGGVGHELRNPLGAIKNAIYYVKGKVAKSELGRKEPRVMEFLDIMDDEVNTSNKIINDLLGFSRVGKPSVSPTRIDKVIEDALSRTPIPENIELTKKLDADLPEVDIDPDQIQQVWVNIIMNAVQAMPKGGKLTIGAKRRGKLLEVEISDTGCGIPQEAVDKIFDPLFTTKAKGIGLGLAVCKAIIDRHEGNIEVESKVGKGTTFIIKLSLKAE